MDVVPGPSSTVAEAFDDAWDEASRRIPEDLVAKRRSLLRTLVALFAGSAETLPSMLAEVLCNPLITFKLAAVEPEHGTLQERCRRLAVVPHVRHPFASASSGSPASRARRRREVDVLSRVRCRDGVASGRQQHCRRLSGACEFLTGGTRRASSGGSSRRRLTTITCLERVLLRDRLLQSLDCCRWRFV